MEYHEPVLLNEVLENLKADKSKTIVDATLGDGGHAIEILKTGATVLGLDYNDESLNRASARIKNLGFTNFYPIKGNFKDIDELITDKVSGILMDLGYSSFHLEGYQKGVSFQKNEELDMRIDTSRGVKAKDLLKVLDVKKLEQIFSVFGEERYSKRIAQEIVRKREVKEIHSTSDLVEIIKSVVPSQQVSRINPATRVFQALRIVVNSELENLKLALPKAENLTLPGGRILIITFHSLEEKLVREFSRDFQPSIKLVGNSPIIPTEAEVRRNPRSRSAKLYVFEKY
jgi:16S rRNA (cytosine1402-N4)-methyltransferase